MKISRFPKNPKAPSEWHMAQVSREALETCASWIRLMVGWRGWSLVKFWWVLETCLGNFAWIFFVVVWGWLLRRLLIYIQLSVLVWGGWFEIHCGCLFCFQEEYYQKQFRVKMLVAVFALYPPNHSNKSGGAAFLNGRMNSEQFQRVGVTWNLLVGN